MRCVVLYTTPANPQYSKKLAIYSRQSRGSSVLVDNIRWQAYPLL